VDEAGNLRLAFEMAGSAPIAWQEIDGRRTSVNVSFRVDGQQVAFTLGKYDPRHALMIDPSLTRNTFLGGSAEDDGRAITVDGSGGVYVTGESTGDWDCMDAFNCTVSAYVGGVDAYAAKLNSSGHLDWNAFLGGEGNDSGHGITVKGGNVYMTGYVWYNFTLTPHRGASLKGRCAIEKYSRSVARR